MGDRLRDVKRVAVRGSSRGVVFLELSDPNDPLQPADPSGLTLFTA
jgi:hypothetical protein